MKNCIIYRILLCFCASVIFVLFITRNISATEEYAQQTGKECAVCHVNPSGGAELTGEGKQFLKSLAADNKDIAKNSASVSIIRLIAGYIHILTAVFWFGTILYVHLVVKPAYAAGGLPRGEVRVGLISMSVMLVTGIILTLLRVSSAGMLFETRFGILLLIKIFFFLMMVAAALIAVFFVSPKLRRQRTVSDQVSGESMTADELAYYDGTEGRPAYIAYADSIYDVSKSGIWRDGTHFFRHKAGSDLTEYLSQAPHGENRILKMPRVGKLVDAGEKQMNIKFKRIFYVLAYFNLSLVLMIIFILALWKWWV
jgi:predicted heme/steroid binding protein